MSMPAKETLKGQETLDTQRLSSAATLHGVQLPPLPFPPEVFRQLYVSLGLPAGRGPVIGITSAVRGEGSTTIALGLAQTLSADLDISVLLVDADMEHSSLADRLSLSPSPGLVGVLNRKAGLSDAMRQVAERLYVVAGHEPEVDSGRLLRELADTDVFESRRAVGAVTILDLPPVLNHSYSPVAASLADALILVIRAGATPVAIVQEAVERLKGSPLQGAVLNGDQRTPRRRLFKRMKKSG